MLCFGNLSKNDYSSFYNFVKNSRTELNIPKLKDKKLQYSRMPFPHEEIAILTGVDYSRIEEYCKKNVLGLTTLI